MNNVPVFDNECIRINRNGILFRTTRRPSSLRFDPISAMLVGVPAATTAAGAGAAGGSMIATTGLIGAGGAVTAGGLVTAASVAAMAAGTGMGVMGKIQEGKDAEKIGNYNAKVDAMNADYARENATETAKIQAEKGRRLMASQTANFAASGVKINEGAPLVIAAQTQADLTKDIGFTLNQGEQQYSNYMSQSALDKTTGKMKKKQSYWDAGETGLSGFGNLAYMGYKGGNLAV